MLNESNITLKFPDQNWFRFQDCTGYQQLSGNHFKEMDVCWHDISNKMFWAIELKDFSGADLTQPEKHEKRVFDILKKAVDSLQMILAFKFKTPYADKSLSLCFPNFPLNPSEIKLVIIINCSEAQASTIQHLNDAFKSRFFPYAKIWGIKHYFIITKDQAIRKISQFTVS